MRGFLDAVRAEYRASAWAVRAVYAHRTETDRRVAVSQYRRMREVVRDGWAAMTDRERAQEVAWVRLFRDHAEGRLPDWATAQQWRHDAITRTPEGGQ